MLTCKNSNYSIILLQVLENLIVLVGSSLKDIIFGYISFCKQAIRYFVFFTPLNI